MNRLHPINWLAEQTGAVHEPEALELLETRAQHLHVQSMLPTIGCEVEVTWSALYPDFIDQHFSNLDPSKTFSTVGAMLRELPLEEQAAYHIHSEQLLAEALPRYEATEVQGIPRGKDAFWEFANSPAYAWQTPARELDLLMESGLIPVDKQNSLHITLGGLAVGKGGAALLLGGLELLNVPPERIVAATKAANHNWARRNSFKGGVIERCDDKLSLGHSVATEFRTLVTARPEDHNAALHAAQMLGAVLLCRRNTDQSNPVIAEIGELWGDYKTILKDLWAERDLPTDDSWSAPYENPQVWRDWADCLERRDEQGSPEQNAVWAINSVIDHTEMLLAAV